MSNEKVGSPLMASSFTVICTLTICIVSLYTSTGAVVTIIKHNCYFLGSFQILRAGSYPKYFKETIIVLFLFILKGISYIGNFICIISILVEARLVLTNLISEISKLVILYHFFFNFLDIQLSHQRGVSVQER